MVPILVVAGLTLLASFLCSLFEAALYAITPAQIEVLRRQGAAQAELLDRLRSNIEEPIAAILTINTIAHTIGASVCGAMVGAQYGSAAVGIFAGVFTLLVLALTEIVPKSLGVRYATKVASEAALPLQVMIWSAWPFVWIATRATRRLIGSAVTAPTEEELLALSGLAARSGAVRDEEHGWVRNALRLDAVTARQLITPRNVVETVPAEMQIREFVSRPERWIHSRLPVTEGTEKERVLGLVHRREVFDRALAPEAAGLTIQDVMRPLPFVPKSMPAHQLLERFLKTREHMVGALDQYGEFEGVVTLEDVLECLLGAEIVDEHDRVADMQELARKRKR
ncbi:MAG: CNNM domain-containing protein [Planctomycetota bacterium]|jgi:CBS domain containing-hemolysin-like protein